jgi:signal transduction histidine kinase
LNIILISVGNSAAYLVVAFAFFVLWRLDRQHQWNLLWCLGHALLAVATLGTNIYGQIGFAPLLIFGDFAFGAAAACLLEGARSLAGRAIRIRLVVLVALLIAFSLVAIGEVDVDYSNYASGMLAFVVYALVGLLLLQRTGSAYRYVSLLMFLRALVVLGLPILPSYGLLTEGLVVANISVVLTGIGLLTAALIDHDRSLQQIQTTLRARGQDLTRANENLEELTVYLERRNVEYAEARDKAEIANRSKSQFLANMSHELRTPLNAIIGFSEMIREGMLGPVGNDTYTEYAANINLSGRHLLELVNDILDLSRAEAGRIELDEASFDPAAMIADCLNMVCEPARRGRIELVMAAEGRMPTLFGDERRIRQIVLNLLSNAIKFTPANGHVSLGSILRADGAFGLMVTDTGIGMSPDQIDVALSPFGQVDSRLSRKFEGAGLGLALTRRLLELHQGKLEIVSTLGAGTTIIAWFPPDRVRPATVDS